MNTPFKLFIGLVVLGMIVSSCNSSKPAAPKTPEELRKGEMDIAPYTCERLIQSRLRDPDSYQPIDKKVYLPKREAQADYDYVAIVNGRSKNGFGGYGPVTFACEFKFGSDKVRIKPL